MYDKLCIDLKMNPINWSTVEYLCRKSFTGGELLPEEQKYLEESYRRFPEEYKRISNSVREEERSRIRVF